MSRTIYKNFKRLNEIFSQLQNESNAEKKTVHTDKIYQVMCGNVILSARFTDDTL